MPKLRACSILTLAVPQVKTEQIQNLCGRSAKFLWPPENIRTLLHEKHCKTVFSIRGRGLKKEREKKEK